MTSEVRITERRRPVAPPAPPEEVWGWLPLQSVVVALGVLLVAIGCSGSRVSAQWSMPVFWVGYLIIIGFPIFRLTMRKVSRQERIGTVLLVGMAFYLIKICYSPLVFNFNDELQHWRSTYDTLQAQSLFSYNPTLPVSSYFPGLESVANAFISISSSVNIVQTGQVMGVAARFLTLLSLFMLFESTTKSGYTAAIACLIYFSDPNFLLGDSQFTYEGLAISLTFTGLYFAFRRIRVDEARGRFGLILVALLCFSSVIVTHHVTSYILAILVSVWGITSLLMMDKLPEWKFGPAGFAVLIVSGCIAWLALVGPIVIPYISVPVRNGFTQAVQVLMGEQAPRTFFQGGNGSSIPFIQKISSYLSVLLLAGLVPFGAWLIWNRRFQNSLALALTAMSFGYYISQLLRLAPLGLSLTNRLAGAVFLPLSFAAAVGATGFITRKYFKNAWRVVLISSLIIINFGSAAAIVAARALPGPYDVNIFSRTINTEGLQTAAWAAEVLGPDNRFGADAINMLIMGSYGRQHLVTEISDNLFFEQSIYSSPEFGPQEMGLLSKGGVDYLVIDTRIEQDKQVVGPLVPDSPAYLTNLDNLATIDRIFDGGHIMIFHLGFVSQVQPSSTGEQP